MGLNLAYDWPKTHQWGLTTAYDWLIEIITITAWQRYRDTSNETHDDTRKKGLTY